MKANSTLVKIRAAVIVFSLLFMVVVALSPAAQAQGRNDRYRRGQTWDNYPNWGGSSDLRQTALNAGYNEGLKDGAEAREKNRSSSDFRNQNTYRRATSDYSSRLGDRSLYQRYFREAYETGFNDGYYPQAYNNNNNNNNNRNRNRDWNRDQDWNRRGRNWDRYDDFGGNSNLRQTALNAGYNEGIKEGRNDRNSSRRSDYRNNSAYQKANKDYSSKLGDRSLYQRYYRAGYENGYYDGLNGN